MTLFLPIFKMNFPEIVDLALPAEGVFHNLVFVSIRKTYPMQARRKCRMTNAEFGIKIRASLPRLLRCEVLFRLCANTDPQRDSIFTIGPSDVLDHATSEIALPREIEYRTGPNESPPVYLTGRGSKLGIDATKKLQGESRFHRDWPPLIKMDAAVKAKVEKLFDP